MNLTFKIDFYGWKIPVIKDSGFFWIPVKPVCQDMGIKYDSQISKLKASKVMSTTPLKGVSSDRKKRIMICIRKDHFGFWLATINPERVNNPKSVERILLYQREACMVLDNYFTKGIAVNFHPTIEQSEELKKDLEEKPELAEYLDELLDHIHQLKKEKSEMMTDVEFGSKNKWGVAKTGTRRFSFVAPPRSKEQIRADRLKKLYGNQPELPFINNTQGK